MFTKRKMLSGLLSLALTASSFFFSPIITQATTSPVLKTMTVTTTASTTQAQTTVVNIPKLLNVVSVTSDTGTVSYNTSGENVTINASGGDSTRTQWNDKKYSTTGTHTLTSMANDLPLTYAYNDGTYTGTIVGQGVTTSTVVTGGSYTPPDTKWVSALSASYSTSAAVPSTYNYNSDGYVGTLTGQGVTQTLVSGSTGPSDTIAVTYQTPTIYCTNYFVSDLMSYPAYSTYNYNVDGYVGTLPVTGYSQWQYNQFINGTMYQIAGYLKYAGNVTRPAFDTRVWSYQQSYQGNATKPAVDTRTYGTQYSQNYSGEVYAGGYDNLYSYTLTIGYYDDIMGLNTDSSALGVNTTNPINIDSLSSLSSSQTIGFDPTLLDEKTVFLNNKYLNISNHKQEALHNDSTHPIDANMYAVSQNGYDYDPWNNLNPNGTFSEDIFFNQPGLYKTRVKFKNYSSESNPLEKDYFVDWIKPTIDVTSKVPGQTAVTGDTYTVTLSATDNLSPYLFYTTDNVNWYLVQSDNQNITFTNIARSATGTLNNLTLKVSDLNGNIAEKTFTVWGIQ